MTLIYKPKVVLFEHNGEGFYGNITGRVWADGRAFRFSCFVVVVFRIGRAWAFFGSLRRTAQHPQPLQQAVATIPAANCAINQIRK